ncbi:PA2G3 phospholipase, partial [Amia calva]|nr:PA2G3 phospholipase [Amia calva]
MYSDIQNGVDFCRLTVTSSSTSGRIYYSFLRRDAGAAGTPFWLYQSAWDRHGQLEHCDATGDQALIYTYLSLCRKDGRGNFSDIQTDSRIDTSILSGPASPCATKSLPEWGMETAGRAKRDLEDAQLGHIPPVQSSGHIAPPSKSLQRKKRSWIIPGTLWCGTGSTAANYADLGVFEQTDNCCREHDHCKATMTAFQFKYGAFNHNLFTVSHCECDQSFRQCLLGVNDTVSNLVGYGFFNILKVPCFVFTPTQQCVQLYWWGRCKISKVAPHALFQTPTPYNSTHPSEEKTDMGWNPEDNDTDIQATTKNRVFATNTSTPAPAVQDVTSGKPSRRRQPGKHRQGDRQKNRGRGDSNKWQSCSCYKHLDQCPLKIAPQEVRFGLQNPETKTLYHCDCTRR